MDWRTLSSLSTFQLVSFFSLAKFNRVASEFVFQLLHPDLFFPMLRALHPDTLCTDCLYALATKKTEAVGMDVASPHDFRHCKWARGGLATDLLHGRQSASDGGQ